MILILPFVLFFWMLPFVAPLTLGNEYPQYTSQEQMELMFSVRTGSFPLYVPGYWGGMSAQGLMMGQIYHPMAWVSSFLPGYWKGYALEWHTLFRILSLGVAHLLLYKMLRRWKLGNVFAFTLSFLTVYNLQMMQQFRFACSLEAWTGHIMLIAAIGLHLFAPRNRLYLVLIAVSMYGMITSGHPQMMYYGLLAVGLFTLMAPFLARHLEPAALPRARDIPRFWATSAAALCVGLLLACAFIVPFYFDFIRANSGRVDAPYEWASTGLDTAVGTFNNFFRPLRSDVNGAFGGSSLFLVAAFVPMLLFLGVKVPAAVLGAWGVVVVALLHMQGEHLPVHRFFWQYMPLANTFRFPGRMNFILPTQFMLILLWILRAPPRTYAFRDRHWKVPLAAPLAVLAILSGALYLSLVNTAQWPPQPHYKYWPALHFKLSAWTEIVPAASGLAALVALMFARWKQPFRRAAVILLAAMTVVQLWPLLRFGTWTTEKEKSRTFTEMAEEKRETLACTPHPAERRGSTVVMTQIQHSFLEPFLGKVYDRSTVAGSVEEAYRYMATNRHPREVVLIGRGAPGGLESAAESQPNTPNRTELLYSSYNRLVFDVHTAGRSAFFGFAFPFTGHWRARVNGQETPVLQANGFAHAIAVPEGTSRVEFRYWSHAAFGGMLISCVTLLGCGILALLWKPRKRATPLWSAFLIAGAAVLFPAWRLSLYAGDNLHTQYDWTSASLPENLNLAYGRRTYTSSLYTPWYPHLHGGFLAVDGNTVARSGFLTHLQDKPFWLLDLGKQCWLKTIHLHEGTTPHPNILARGWAWNTRPVLLAVSDDGREWRPIAHISQPKQDEPIVLDLPSPVACRFVLLQPQAACAFHVNEVRIFGPES